MYKIYLYSVAFSFVSWFLFNRLYSQTPITPKNLLSLVLYAIPVVNVLLSLILLPMAIIRGLYLAKIIDFDPKERIKGLVTKD